MNAIRLRVGDLDAWRTYLCPPYPAMEMSTEDFIASMRRETKPTEQMRIGAAYHSVLEKAVDGVEYEEVEQDGFVFHLAGDFIISDAPTRETLLEWWLDVPAGRVLLRGKVDAWHGNTVTDYKLTFSGFDAERYADSMQWRAYLEMTGADRFRYLVFEANQHGPHIWVHAMHEFTMWRYPEMAEEVTSCASGLADFVRGHVLTAA